MYASLYVSPMPTALRDMQPWRQALIERGLSMAWLAARTGVSVDTVRSYAIGRRNPSAEWIAKVERVLAGVEVTA